MQQLKLLSAFLALASSISLSDEPSKVGILPLPEKTHSITDIQRKEAPQEPNKHDTTLAQVECQKTKRKERAARQNPPTLESNTPVGTAKISKLEAKPAVVDQKTSEAEQ